MGSTPQLCRPHLPITFLIISLSSPYLGLQLLHGALVHEAAHRDREVEQPLADEVLWETKMREESRLTDWLKMRITIRAAAHIHRKGAQKLRYVLSRQASTMLNHPREVQHILLAPCRHRSALQMATRHAWRKPQQQNNL